MARNVRKTAIVETVDTTPPAGIGDNSLAELRAKLDENAKLIDDYAKQALEDDAKGGELLGSAVQRMAAAIYLHTATLPNGQAMSLDDYFKLTDGKLSTTGQNTFKRIMRIRMIGTASPPKMPAAQKGEINITHLDAVQAWNKKANLVNRACKFAACLKRRLVSIEAFDPIKGQWDVLADHLLNPNTTLLDELKGTVVPLDGKGVQYRRTMPGGANYGSVQASVTQYEKVNAVTNPREQDETDTPASGSPDGEHADMSLRDAMYVVKSNLRAVLTPSTMASKDWTPASHYTAEEMETLTEIDQLITRLKHIIAGGKPVDIKAA